MCRFGDWLGFGTARTHGSMNAPSGNAQRNANCEGKLLASGELCCAAEEFEAAGVNVSALLVGCVWSRWRQASVCWFWSSSAQLRASSSMSRACPACQASSSPAPVQVVSAVTHVITRCQAPPYFTLLLPAPDHSLGLAMDPFNNNGFNTPQDGSHYRSPSHSAQNDTGYNAQDDTGHSARNNTGYNAQNNAAFAQVSIFMHSQPCACRANSSKTILHNPVVAWSVLSLAKAPRCIRA
jgi:hypothetical protein